MHTSVARLPLALGAATLCLTTVGSPMLGVAQSGPEIPPAITTPDVVETPLGAMNFEDGVPSKETAAKAYDLADFTYAYRAFMDNMRGVSIAAIHQGLQDAGVKDGQVLLFSELMDSNSLFLTANCDTIYAMGALDMTKGPMVIESPRLCRKPQSAS